MLMLANYFNAGNKVIIHHRKQDLVTRHVIRKIGI